MRGKLQIAVKTKQRSGRVSRTPVIVDRGGSVALKKAKSCISFHVSINGIYLTIVPLHGYNFIMSNYVNIGNCWK
jgi:hypothetical protein